MPDTDFTVTVFEDNAALREGIAEILNASQGFLCIGAYANCKKVIEVLEKNLPDAVLMDIQMPGISGIEAVSIIKNKFPGLPVIMHTVFDDEDKLFACLTNGADGYILKRDSSEQLIPAIREVVSGGAPMSPGIARKVLNAFHPSAESSQDKFHITMRETQILESLAKGFSYRMIGIEYSISPETVKRHLKNIYEKLHVQCGPEAVAKAIREKIIL